MKIDTEFAMSIVGDLDYNLVIPVVEEFIKLLNKKSSLNQIILPTNFQQTKTHPIFINVSSTGGRLDPSVAIYEQIRCLAEQNQRKIITIGSGKIGSAAVLLFMLGEERIITKNTILFLHEITRWFREQSCNPSELSTFAATLEERQDFYIRTILEKSGLCKDKILEMMKENSSITAKDALSLGLATKII